MPTMGALSAIGCTDVDCACTDADAGPLLIARPAVISPAIIAIAADRDRYHDACRVARGVARCVASRVGATNAPSCIGARPDHVFGDHVFGLSPEIRHLTAP